MDCGCRVLSFLCLYFQFDGERVMQFLVSVYTSASNVSKPHFQFLYVYINYKCIYTFYIFIITIIICSYYVLLEFFPEFLLSWNQRFLLVFVYLDLSTWICLSEFVYLDLFWK